MPPRIALAVTVRDESQLLRANLEYHHHLGVDRAYVYLDEGDDRTSRTVVDLPFVEISECVSPSRFGDRADLRVFVESWSTHLSARQSLNVVDAMARAADAGCEWLISIDADELVCLDRQRAEAGALSARLAGVAPEVVTALFPSLEVAQGLRASDLIFGEGLHFKRGGASMRCEVRDPRDGKRVSRPSFFGHLVGKSAVRLGHPARPLSSHRFVTPAGEPLEHAVVGELLHYYAYDFADSMKRCRSYHGHADRHVTGEAVVPHKLLWIELVNEAGLDSEQLERYYNETIAFDDDARQRLSRWHWTRPFQKPPLVEVPAVIMFFSGRERAPRARSDAPRS